MAIKRYTRFSIRYVREFIFSILKPMKHYYDEKIGDYVTYISDVIDVVSVKPLEDYLLQVTFSDKAVKIYDVKPLLDKGVFKKLKNPFIFKKAYIDYGTVVWENGEIDIAPETLYTNSSAMV